MYVAYIIIVYNRLMGSLYNFLLFLFLCISTFAPAVSKPNINKLKNITKKKLVKKKQEFFNLFIVMKL